jgi:hypothetical protein
MPEVSDFIQKKLDQAVDRERQRVEHERLLEMQPDIAKLREEAARDRLHWRGTERLPLDVSRAAVELADEERARRRISPRRNRWTAIAELDARATRFEQRQADLHAELAVASEQHVEARRTDKEQLARWVADPSVGERPLPTAPRIEERISELRDEHEALTSVISAVLVEKAAYVERHRSRLVKQAAKERVRAVERLQQAIAAVEEAREETADVVAAEHWAKTYPEEGANAAALWLPRMLGGRLSKALPDYTGLALIGQVLAWLRDDAAWLDRAVADEEPRELDPHEEPIWEDSEEGKAAMRLANKRIAEGLKPRNVHAAGWED